MAVTVELLADSRIRLDDAEVTARSTDEVAFRVEGTVTLTEALVGEFAGRRLAPEAVAFSVDDAELVEVTLEGETALRLETVDVGVETPDAPDGDATFESAEARPSVDDAPELSGSPSGVLAFTVAGAIENVAADDFEALSAGEAVPASIALSVDETPEPDGGDPDDALVRLRVLGYELAVWADGTVVVGRRGGGSEGVL